MTEKWLYRAAVLTIAAVVVVVVARPSSQPQAGYIDLGSTTHGSLTGERDADWWHFEGRAAQVVRVVAPTDGFHPSLRLFASDQQEVTAVPGYDDELVDQLFILPRSDRYRLRIAGGGGAYELATSIVEPVARLQSGAPAVGDYQSDELLWTFAGEAGRAVVIAAKSVPNPLEGGTPPVVYLLAPDGELLEQAVEYGLECRGCQDTEVEHGARLIRFLPASGDYRVLVATLGPWAGTPASYEVTMRVVDDANVARTGYSTSGSLDSRQDVDIWTLEDDGRPLMVKIDSGTYGIIGMLGEGSARQVGTALVATTPGSGPRRVVVTSNWGADRDGRALGAGDYAVTVQDAARLPRAEAGSVVGGSSRQRANVWRLEGRAGQIVGISVRDGWFSNIVELYSPTGNQIVDGAVDYVRDVGAYSAHLPTSGPYMLRVEDAGAVRLWAADMGELGMRSPEKGVLRGVAWRDQWRFRCPVGEMVVLTMTLPENFEFFRSGSGVYSSAGGEVNGVPVGADGHGAFCSDRGEHWAGVMAMPRGGWDPAWLDREIEYEVLLDTVVATPLELGDVQLGNLGDGGVDLWSFSGNAGQTVDVRLSTAGDGLADVRWYFETGEMILEHRLFVGDTVEESIQVMLPYSGRYFMDVTDWRGETGAYEVWVQ